MNWLKSFWKGLTEAQPSEAQVSMDSLKQFSPRAQQVLALARKQAERFNHNFVGTEHVLLGLIEFGQGTAVTVLRKMGLELETVRMEVEKQVGTGPDHKMIGNIPYTPRVKKVLALAAKEAKALNHTYVGTEHILLGLLREGEGVAARILKNFDVNVEETRSEILKELDPNFNAKLQDKTRGSEYEEPWSAEREDIDPRNHYDVYCIEGDREVVYRNARFKGARKLLPGEECAAQAEFIELEQVDGPTWFIARRAIVKFCEHVE